jgi:hypothetical protein
MSLSRFCTKSLETPLKVSARRLRWSRGSVLAFGSQVRSRGSVLAFGSQVRSRGSVLAFGSQVRSRGSVLAFGSQVRSRGSVLAFGTQVRGFTPSRSRRIFRAKNSSARLPSEGK